MFVGTCSQNTNIQVIIAIYPYMQENTTSAPIYLHCLRSYGDWRTQDRLGFLCQTLGGFFSVKGDCVLYFVPESHAYMMYLIDSDLRRCEHLDYIK